MNIYKKALETIEQLTAAMSLAKDSIIKRHGLGDPLCNILSYDAEDICVELERATEMASEKHTPDGSPRPWRLIGDEFHGFGVVAADGAVIVETHTLPLLDAMRIVRSVNSHAELLLILCRLLDGIVRLPELPATLCPLDIEQARAAIAKAEGRA